MDTSRDKMQLVKDKSSSKVCSSTACSFTFSEETSRKDFGLKALKVFLMKRNLYDRGLWKQICPRTMSSGSKFGMMQKTHQPFVMAKESLILQSPIQDVPPLEQPVQNWREYYKLRGFELDSPIAGLLDYPLTAYWIITNYLAALTHERMEKQQRLTVHVIGAEKEADMFPAFLEFSRLLSPIHVRLDMFGNEISTQVNGFSEEQENMFFKLHSCLYHESDLIQHSPPDLVLGFNAGLSAYPSFRDTIKMILDNAIPLICTDYCEESVLHSKRTLEDAELGQVVNIVKNPFHGPFRIPLSNLESSSFSNAFVFTIQRDPSVHQIP